MENHLVCLSYTNVLKGILRAQTARFPVEAADISIILNKAREYYPPDLCKKSVHAAIVGESRHGEFIAYSRNGIPTATSESLDIFSAEKMLATARNIDDPRLDGAIEYLEKRPDSSVVGCVLLNEEIPSGTCLKGYQPTGINKGSFRPNSADDCPNQRAGNCAERVLINWLPFIYALMENKYNESGQNHNYEIGELIFERGKDKSPTIIYRIKDGATQIGSTVNESWIGEKIEGGQCDSVQPDQKEQIFSEVLPCPACAEAIVDLGIKSVHILSLSRHEKEGNQALDEDDIAAINQLIEHGVNLNFPDISHTHIEKRN